MASPHFAAVDAWREVETRKQKPVNRLPAPQEARYVSLGGCPILRWAIDVRSFSPLHLSYCTICLFRVNAVPVDAYLLRTRLRDGEYIGHW